MNKEHIIREIKRTAAENGGVPLGFRRFFTETGIKRADWEGVYWARWADAVREAGLTANQLSAAHDESNLLNRYAELAVQLGRLPTSADLKLRCRGKGDFPSEKAFRRWTKAELVKELLEHCEKNGELKQVEGWCQEYLAGVRVPADDGDAEPEIEFGFVYLFKSGRYYKIGKTNSVGRRQYELDIQLPERATTVHEIRTDDPDGIEGYWHKRFAAKRKNGEWFELDAADIAAFKRRKIM
ncbi:MAG TPA: GIY-YIG nuclease family protein [Gemmataceae bacterium]|jgi:hypothetical protein|nr:GIY-YIG nuclease family protein [Gemmataceae bacterium]